MSGTMEKRRTESRQESQPCRAYSPKDGVWTLIQVLHEVIGEPSRRLA